MQKCCLPPRGFQCFVIDRLMEYSYGAEFVAL